MDIDIVLRNLSYDVFSNLEDGELLIIKTLAREGPLSITEIGKFSARYSRGFDRWGVKKRLDGTAKFNGLIPNDYVFKITLNEKESKYGLNIKGLLASLHEIKFEKTFPVKEYESFLSNRYLKDKKLALWAIQMIKYEITLILYFIKIQGLDWTKFKQTKLFINDLKLASRELLRAFFMNLESLESVDREEFQKIKNEYLSLVIIIHLITEIKDNPLMYPLDRYENYRGLDEIGKLKRDILNDIHNWHKQIGITQLDACKNLSLEKRLKIIEEFEHMPERQFSDPHGELFYQQPIINEIINMLENDGYSIEKRKNREYS